MKTYDEQHQHFRREMNKSKWKVRFGQLGILISFLLLWQIASLNFWIDPLLFSSPSTIFDYLVTNIANGTLGPHISITVIETICAFLLATTLGLFTAALLWWFPLLSKMIDPFLVILNALPKVALGPIIIIIFGPMMSSVIAMGVIVSIIITILVIYNQFNETDPNFLKLFSSFQATKWQTFRYCVFPNSIPTILSTLKVNVGLAWVGVIVGEFLVSKQGLGYLIVYGFQLFDFTLVLSSVTLIGFCAFIMYGIQTFLEKKLLKLTK